MSQQVQNFQEFIRRSPSAFHAVENICQTLSQNGFQPLQERETWNIVPGGKYYVTRNRSSVIALTIPEKGFSHFQIVASHSDSPTFKLKPIFEEEVCGKFLRLNTEKYGGLVLSTWLDRPLSIAGRVLVKNGGRIETRLVDLDRDSVMIPNLPIHVNRELNDGFKYNPQVDLLPIYGGENSKGKLKQEIADCCGTTPESIVGGDLFLYNRTPGSIWGANNEFFSCPKIDDLECAYTSLQAFLAAKDAPSIRVLAVFDNEEVGSSTKQGANSTFLGDVFARVAASLGATDEQRRAAVASSFMVSADNAHSVHPAHPEKYDADNRTFMNEGVVIKHHAGQSYTTDGVSDAIFSAICEMANVPVQHFTNRSDVNGGSTLGNIANTQQSMNTVDIGLPQLSMHSSYETAGVKDVDFMIRALTKFYETDIVVESDGLFELK